MDIQGIPPNDPRVVVIDYVCARGETSRRAVTVEAMDGGSIEGHCHLRDDHRCFLLDRIEHMEDASGAEIGPGALARRLAALDAPFEAPGRAGEAVRHLYPAIEVAAALLPTGQRRAEAITRLTDHLVEALRHVDDGDEEELDAAERADLEALVAQVPPATPSVVAPVMKRMANKGRLWEVLEACERAAGPVAEMSPVTAMALGEVRGMARVLG